MIMAAGNSSNFARCYLFVDGAYVRERRTERGLGLEFDPRGPATYLQRLRILGKQQTVVRCFYFDALDHEDPEMVTFFEKMRGLDDTHVYLGRLVKGGSRRATKRCGYTTGGCGSQGRWVWKCRCHCACNGGPRLHPSR